MATVARWERTERRAPDREDFADLRVARPPAGANTESTHADILADVCEVVGKEAWKGAGGRRAAWVSCSVEATSKLWIVGSNELRRAWLAAIIQNLPRQHAAFCPDPMGDIR
jgi:hypothetical protein